MAGDYAGHCFAGTTRLSRGAQLGRLQRGASDWAAARRTGHSGRGIGNGIPAECGVVLWRHLLSVSLEVHTSRTSRERRGDAGHSHRPALYARLGTSEGCAGADRGVQFFGDRAAGVVAADRQTIRIGWIWLSSGMLRDGRAERSGCAAASAAAAIHGRAGGLGDGHICRRDFRRRTRAIVCLARYPSVSRRRGVDRNPRMPELHGPDDVPVLGAGALTFHVPASVAGWDGGGKRGVGSTGSAYGNSICHDVRGHRSFRWTGRDQMASADCAASRRTRATHRARVNLSNRTYTDFHGEDGWHFVTEPKATNCEIARLQITNYQITNLPASSALKVFRRVVHCSAHKRSS